MPEQDQALKISKQEPISDRYVPASLHIIIHPEHRVIIDVYTGYKDGEGNFVRTGQERIDLKNIPAVRGDDFVIITPADNKATDFMVALNQSGNLKATFKAKVQEYLA